MLHQILEQQPLPFAERGRAPWPEMEATLARALEKDPAGRFGSMATLADALDAICADAATDPAAALGKGQRDAGGEGVRLAGAGRRPAGELPAGLQTVLDRHLRNVALEGPLFVSGIAGTPTASVVFGASGIAAALYRIASQRDDHELLALADAWSCRAVKLAAGDDAFYSERLEITPDRVGEASVYHSPTGVFAVQALIARRMGDEVSQGAAIEAFLGAAARPMVGIDLNLGHCGALLAGAMLLETLPADESPLRAALIGWGNRTLQHVWEGLDAQAAIPEAEIDNLGIAHGWAGFLYASLHWCAGAGADMPAGAEQRLDQLAELAEPVGRGLRWPWRVTADPRQTIYMPGWCNGSAGYVFTWTLAHRLFGAQRYRQLAEGAAWDAWDSTESYGTLCCGLVGRAYALLNIHRHTGERDWLYRAIELGRRAADSGQFQPDLAHSLYKGELALAVLAADLQQPDAAVQPLFEPEGWPTRAA
jgi:serine/threonine-protein kinase